MSETILENYYRLSCPQIEDKIKRLEIRAKKNPQDKNDIDLEIKDLKEILKKKKKEQNESYNSLLDRLSRTK